MLKKFGTTLLMLSLATPVIMTAQENQGEHRAEEKREGKERHPAIRHAIQALEKAKVDLNHADHDFGGHRAEALEAIDNAIKQLREALKYDKK